MPDTERGREVINSFCERMGLLTRTEWKPVRWSDDEKPGMGECDVIISRNGEEWAADHTRLESFAQHSYDNALFSEIVAPVEKLLRRLFPKERVNINVPIRAFAGANRDQAKSAFLFDCAAVLPAVPATDDRKAEPRRVHAVHLPSVTVNAHLMRKTNASVPGVYVGRYADFPLLHRELVHCLKVAIEKKHRQLLRQKAKGYRTILLFDTQDFATLTEGKVAEAFQEATRCIATSAIDEVFLFDEHSQSTLVWPLRYRGIEYPEEKWYREFTPAQAKMLWGDGDWPPYLDCP